MQGLKEVWPEKFQSDEDSSEKNSLFFRSLFSGFSVVKFAYATGVAGRRDAE